MSYATVDEIVDEFKSLVIDEAKSVMTTSKIQSFIDQAGAEIDSFIFERYVLPVTGTKSALFLKKICIDLVSFRVTKIISIKNAIPDSKGVYQEILEGAFYREAMAKLKKIHNGDLKLVDAPEAGGSPVRSYSQKATLTPIFKKNERQW